MASAEPTLPPDEADDTDRIPPGPEDNPETVRALRGIYSEITKLKQARKTAGEGIKSAREQAVTFGISKKAQAAVEAFMNLNEADQEHFDQAVAIYRKAIGRPIQASLSLVPPAE